MGGFSVDYAAHIAESFCNNFKGERGERRVAPWEAMCRSLTTTGFSVLNGGVSTWLAVAVLAGSSTKAFTDLFKTFFLMVLFGLSHGLVLMPVTLVALQTGAAKLRSK